MIINFKVENFKRIKNQVTIDCINNSATNIATKKLDLQQSNDSNVEIKVVNNTETIANQKGSFSAEDFKLHSFGEEPKDEVPKKEQTVSYNTEKETVEVNKVTTFFSEKNVGKTSLVDSLFTLKNILLGEQFKLETYHRRVDPIVKFELTYMDGKNINVYELHIDTTYDENKIILESFSYDDHYLFYIDRTISKFHAKDPRAKSVIEESCEKTPFFLTEGLESTKFIGYTKRSIQRLAKRIVFIDVNDPTFTHAYRIVDSNDKTAQNIYLDFLTKCNVNIENSSFENYLIEVGKILSLYRMNKNSLKESTLADKMSISCHVGTVLDSLLLGNIVVIDDTHLFENFDFIKEMYNHFYTELNINAQLLLFSDSKIMSNLAQYMVEDQMFKLVDNEEEETFEITSVSNKTIKKPV